MTRLFSKTIAGTGRSAGSQRRERVLDGGDDRTMRRNGCPESGDISEATARAGEFVRRSTSRQRGESFLDGGDVRTLGGYRGLQRGYVGRHSDKHVEKEPEGPNENRDDPGADSGHPAHAGLEFHNSSPEFGNVARPEFGNVSLCRDTAGDTGLNRGGNGLGLRLFDPRVPKAPGYRHGVKRNVRGHVRWSFRSCLSDIASFVPDFQPVTRRALAIATSFLLALPVPAFAQSDLSGATTDDPSDIRTALGECRADLLRDAWTEIAPLEAEAVEREVLALCTERSEAIAEFLDSQARLDGALSLLRAPSPAAAQATGVVAGPNAEHMERLRDEVESLRTRIARLEGLPEGPETEAVLAELREDLAAAEADLAIVEVETAMGAGFSDDPPPPSEAGSVAEETAPRMAVADPRDPFAVVGPVAGDAVEDPPLPTAPSGEAPGAGPDGAEEALASLPPPGVPVPDATAGDTAAGAVLPPDRLTGWRLIHAVRRDGGPWLIRMQALRETAFPVPGPDPADPDAEANLRGVRWVPQADPPVTLAVGDELPDGAVVLAVTAEGVELSDPSSPDGEPVLLPFVGDDDGVPGALVWEFELQREEGG